MPDQSSVTARDITGELQRLGIAPGDAVFVHSSLSRFGFVEGGAEAVCRAVVDAVSPGGTVLMPAFTFGFREAKDPVLDVRSSPSCVGLVSETFRTVFATHRSHHLTHSVAAAGGQALWLTSGRTHDPFSLDSPFGRLTRLEGDRGAVALLGVDYNSCTFFHAIEGALPVPYMGMTPKPDGRVRLLSGEVVPADCSVHLPTERYDFNRAAARLEGEGHTAVGRCGNSVIRVFRARPVFERLLEELRGDPCALTRRGDRALKIPVSAGWR